MTVDDASLTTAALALGTVISWDVLFSWLGFRSRFAAMLLKGRPRLLVKDGLPLREELHASRISMDELLSRAREAGLGDLGRVDQAHLETDGKISFVLRTSRSAP
jgi:Predicted membrane protein